MAERKMAERKEIIKFDKVYFKYNGMHESKLDLFAVCNANFSIYEGEFIAIVGKNGSGKSTIAKLMNAIHEPSNENGSVLVYGINTKDSQSKFEVRKKVGMIFQNPDNAMVASIVEDDIAFGPENLGLERSEIIERVDYALKCLGMESFRNRTPHKLSGGQKQKIAIAGVLALRPKVLVLDESTAMLDPKGRKEVLSTLLKLNKEEGITIVLITHYMDEVMFADRVLVVSEGTIKLSSSPKDVFKEDKKLIEYGLTIPRTIELERKLSDYGIEINSFLNDPRILAEKVSSEIRLIRESQGKGANNGN